MAKVAANSAKGFIWMDKIACGCSFKMEFSFSRLPDFLLNGSVGCFQDGQWEFTPWICETLHRQVSVSLLSPVQL